MMTANELRRLAARAQPLWDRVGASRPPDDADAAAAQSVARWRRQVGEGDPVIFARRLAWAGWDEPRAQSALSAASLPPLGELPCWACVLDDISREAIDFEQGHPGIDPLCDRNEGLDYAVFADEPLPFEELLLPAVSIARRRLHSALAPLRGRFAGSLSGLLAAPAYHAAERALLQRLAELSAKTIGLEFSEFRPIQYGLLALLPGLAAEPPRAWYERFVAELLSQGLVPLWEKYPVLGRLLATAVEFWTEEFAEFLVRLAADRDDIDRNLASGALGPVTRLTQDLSDPHHRGRTVRIVGFAYGQLVVYKPRSVAPEIGLGLMLDWCNDRLAAPQFRVIRHLDRGGYGWALDCVAPEPCPSRAAVERFYERAGMLLCLAYGLDANDLHSENLIAAGEHPVIIDAETLMHPRATGELSDPQILEEDASLVGDFVLRTGLLPRWSFDGAARTAYDISGLGRTGQQSAPWQAWRWIAVNTDYMTLHPRDVDLPPQGNAPTFNGAPVSPGDHVDAICAGFTRLYRLLRDHRDELLGDEPLLSHLRTQPVRFLFRPTEVYGALLDGARLPQHLRDGAERSIELNALANVFLAAPRPSGAWPLLAAELAALEQMDIPYFHTTASSHTISIGLGEPIADFFDGGGFSGFVERLRRLDDDDLARQLGLIRGTFVAWAVRQTFAQPAPSDASGASAPVALEPAQLVAAASVIADDIAAHAIRQGSGRVGWLGLRYAAKARRFQFEPVGLNLYDGRCGVAFFLAALDAIEHRSDRRGLVLETLEAPRRLLRDAKGRANAVVRRLGIGGASGLGSIIYAFTRVGQWAGEQVLLDEACAAAPLIDNEAVARDASLDVIDGAAGAILGLLAVHQATGERVALERAIACGDHLLARQVEAAGARTWRTLGATPLTGFSHGAAGIAYALLRLHAATGQDHYLEAARQGIAYERRCYSASAGNWPDFRISDDEPGFAMSWCHGAPGIGLARLGGLGLGEIDRVADEIENALCATRAMELHPTDHVCCGNLGLAETLLVAATKLDRPDLMRDTAYLVARVCRRADREGGFRLFADMPVDVHNPSLFQGSAGIGYTLLRLAYPGMLPSLPLWQ